MTVRFAEDLNATAVAQTTYPPIMHPHTGISKPPTPPHSHNPNRKRVRHRPNRRLRAQSVVSASAGDISGLAPRSRHHTTPPFHDISTKLSEEDLEFYGSTLDKQESAESRDRRMFGGQDDDSESARQLRGPMLDVVLGLFNGLDYDDSHWG